MMNLTIKHLRRSAITNSLSKQTTLKRAIIRLGFVQADPIRSPARAQDLILRHRVKNYCVGDLARSYASLDLEEDFLYAYGFMPNALWRKLHPRQTTTLTAEEQQILTIVSAQGRLHPNQLGAYFGSERERNAWGGYSKATTRLLQSLHYRGFLRIVGRERGIRIYGCTPAVETYEGDPEHRLRDIVLQMAAIFAPAPERSFKRLLQNLQYAAPALDGRKSALKQLLASGHLEACTVNDIRYIWPTGAITKRCPDDKVRFLAPFDPIVWDRNRFEHFWGWSYRFEAYTPIAKRKLGYYAMPLLWRDDVIGWVNVSRRGAESQVDPGFCAHSPSDSRFKIEYAAEVERFHNFMKSDAES